MKVKRYTVELIALITIAALLVWKFWPEENSATADSTTPPAAIKSATLPVAVSPPAVEAPKIEPAQVSSTADSVLLPGNGASLYDASKARAASPGSTATTDEDYNAIVKGSPELAKLDNKLTQNAAAVQSLAPIDPSTVPPLVVSELGEIALTQDQPEIRKLASGDEAIFTLITSAAIAKGNSGRFIVSVEFLHPNADGSFDTGIKAAIAVQPGQPAVIKSTSTGNEIHFGLELAGHADASP